MIRTRVLRLLAGIAAAVPAALLLGAPPAAAHPMPHSVVLLDVGETSVTAHLELPLSDFARASGIDVTQTTLASQTDALRRYLTAHIRPTTTGGQAWTVGIGSPALSQAEQTSTGVYRELTAEATLTPPAGGDLRHFTFAYDVIVHQVVTHTVLVSVRQDWAAGRVGESAAQVGTIGIDTRTMTVPALTVDLESGSVWSGFAAMAELGGNHILEGTDHLLFLLILLLSAPLLAAGGRWREPAGTRAAISRIGRTTLAFTVGHSAALALSTLTHLDVPAWPVESFIAASILISAIHAIRPLFPSREAAVAGFFGLGHGMAFSFTLAEMHLSTGRLALSLLGFNLGIEAVQLLLVTLALPTLLAVTRTRIGRAFRVTAASITAVAATGWLADRLGFANPAARAADAIGARTTPLMIVLTATAIAAITWLTINRRTAVPELARPGLAGQRRGTTRPAS